MRTQRTLRREVSCTGIGLHGGKRVNMLDWFMNRNFMTNWANSDPTAAQPERHPAASGQIIPAALHPSGYHDTNHDHPSKIDENKDYLCHISTHKTLLEFFRTTPSCLPPFPHLSSSKESAESLLMPLSFFDTQADARPATPAPINGVGTRSRLVPR